MEINQYDIVLVDLNPTVGSEMKKTRPCVVISPNEMNKFLRTIIIAPMTSNLKKYPTRVRIIHNNTEGMIALDQIRTVDKLRVVKVFNSISKSEIKQVKNILKEIFVE